MIDCRRLVIRPASRGDVERLHGVLDVDHYEYFLECLTGPRRRSQRVLVALYEGSPVGACTVRWSGAVEPEVRACLPEIPQLYHFVVRPDCRRCGVGTALLRAAEGMLRARGYKHVLLGVDESNKDARRLYERQGYLSRRNECPTGLRVLAPDGSPVGDPYDILVAPLVRQRRHGRRRRPWSSAILACGVRGGQVPAHGRPTR